MNERIRELADKIWAEEYWTNPNTDRLLPAQLNKFAELIVRECADHIMSSSDRYRKEYFAEKILKHFGVE